MEELKSINWMRIIGAVSTTILVGLVLYGSYMFWSGNIKPTTINNYTTVQPGATMNVDQGKSRESRLGLLVGPLLVDGHIGVFAGLTWRF